MHSSRSPRTEARRCAQELYRLVSSSQAGLVIVVGVGWGYLIEEIYSADLQKSPAFLKQTSLLFFEPISQVHQLLENRGRLSIFNKWGIKLICDPYALKQKLQGKGDFHLYISPVYKRLFPHLLGEISSFLKKELKEEDVKEKKSGKKESPNVDQSTARRFLRQWMRNAFCLTAAQEELCFLSYKKKSRAMNSSPPLLVYCGASPTLLKDMQYVPEDAFLIASDTALAPLLAARRKVGMALCVDSGRASLYHLRAAMHFLKKKDQPFDFPVLSWSGGLPHLDRWFSRVYYYRSTLPFDQILASGPLGSLAEWKNPARNPLGLALHLSWLLDVPELYCAGTSFRSQNGLSHEKGTGYQEYALDRIHRLFCLDMYKPGGYSENWTPKNRLAWDGALELGRDLGIRLKKIEQKRLPLKAAKKSVTGKGPLQVSFDSVCIPTKHIRDFLLAAREAMDFSSLKEMGLRPASVDKYMAFFQRLI